MSERTVFSMRAATGTLRALADEARRYRIPPRTLAEEILEEGVKMRRHPGIVFVERGGGRAAVLAGRPRLSVWQVVETVRANRTRAAAAKWLSVDEASIDRAMSYADDNPGEIEEKIRQNDEAFERAQRLYPPALPPARRPRRAAPSR